MSTTIDERVVEMRFDNKHFEQNVQTSLNSINDLKKSLNMTGATKGLQDIDSAAKRVDMTSMGYAVDTVQAKFSALQVMAVTALANITNSAVNAGKRIVAALTIDPIKTGLQEYETQINAVQTILANTESKGTTIKDVNKALDELNTYADKTIYNFTEMTRNIGTFTAAGVDLDTSVTAIQGIANLAAVSGSTSQQASTAMYQLSQAISTGTVRLMDWNSVVNAGMGGQVFQDALKETARAHGIAIDDIIEANGSFRESLQEGWLSAEILTETLSHFTMAAEEGSDEWKAFKKELMDSGYTEEQASAILKLSNTATDAATKVKTFTQLWDTLKETAQSGWSQTWEIIFGDFEEAKTFFSDLYNTLAPLIESTSKARNDLLQAWKDDGGRQHLIDSLYNAFEGLKSIVVPIKDAFKEIFPPITAKNLLAITSSLKEFTAGLKLGDEASKNLKSTFKGVFATFDILGQLLSAVLKSIFPMFKGFGQVGGGVLKLTAAWGEWMTKLSETIRKTDIFYKTFSGLTQIVTFAIGVFKKFAGVMKEKIVLPGIDKLHALLSRIRERFSGVTDAVTNMKEGVSSSFGSMSNAIEQSSFFKLISKFWDFLSAIGKGAAKIFGGIASGMLKVFGDANFDGIFDLINSISISSIAIFVAKFMKGFNDVAGSLGDFKDSVLGILDSVRGCFEAYQQQLKAGTLMKIAQAIAILAAAIFVIALIDSEKLAESLGAITVLFADLLASMSLFGKVSGDISGVIKSSTAMISMSVAVLILAVAMKTLEGLDWNDIAKGIVAIAAMTSMLVGTVKLLNLGGNSMLKGATKMVIFSAALAIMASVFKSFRTLNWEEIAKGITAISVLSSVIVGTAKLLNLGGASVIKGATNMIIFSAAVAILASVCKSMSSLKWSELVKGLVAVAALSSVMVGTAKLLNLGGGSTIKGAAQMVFFAAAIKVLASACEDFGTMRWEEIAKGLVAIASMSAMLVAAVKMVGGSSGAKLAGVAVGLIAAAAALVIMSKALQAMGSMSWEEVAKGLIALGGAMLIIAAGLYAMQGTLAGSAALFVAAVAIAVFAPALAKLGDMSVGEIAKGLLTIAAAFVILGVAGYVLSGAVGPILAISAALLLAGLGITALGVGVVLLSTGLTMLAATIVTSSSAVATGLTILITTAAELLPFVATKIGEAIIALCTVITEGAPAIAEALMSVIVSLCGLLAEASPILADTLLKVILSVLDALVTYTPDIVDRLFQFLIQVLEGVAKNLPDLIQAAVDVIMAFFEGVIQAMGTIDTETIIQGIAGVGLISGLMTALAAAGALAPAAMVGVLALGAVIAELALVIAAIGGLAQLPGLEWLISEGGDFLEVVGVAIGKFIGGIVGGVASGVTGQLPDMASDLANFMANLQPFIDGAKAIEPATLEGVKTLTEVILALTAANILEGLTSWFTGGDSITKFATELPVLGMGLKGFSDAVTGIDVASVKAASEAAKNLADMCKTIPNEGGVIGWLAGENSIAKFGSELPILGAGLKGLSDAVIGIIPENIAAAATAAKALTDMASSIPNDGGVVAWFTGENSIAKFAAELPVLGNGLKGFSDSVAGIIPDNIKAAANAAKELAIMADTIPDTGGVAAWFTGENSISKFSLELLTLGAGLKGFSNAVAGIVPENVTAAANAAKALAEMANTVPDSGGVAAWFTGDNSIAKFGDKLPALGKGLKGFSDSVTGISPENVTAAANAGKTLATIADTVPKDTSHLESFGTNMSIFGSKIKVFFTNMSGVTTETIAVAEGAMNVVSDAATLSVGNIQTAATAIYNIGVALTSLKDVPKDVGAAFKQNMEDVSSSSVSSLATALEEAQPTVYGKSVDLMQKLMAGIEDTKTKVAAECEKVANACILKLNAAYDSFVTAGCYVVEGFTSGIIANTWMATAAAASMAKAAADAAKAELDINSPSRVFYGIGDFAGQGFVNALDDYSSISYKAGAGMATSAREGLNDAISKVADFIDSGIDTQPTIRPVLDLSSVESGASAISGLLGGNVVGVSTNVGAISTMMNRRNQNGNNADVVSAINGLRKDLENTGSTTNIIEGITYDDGSNVSEALKTIIQAAKIERRV